MAVVDQAQLEMLPAGDAVARRRSRRPEPPSHSDEPSRERDALAERFADRISVNPAFTRQIVSYQGNRGLPGLRWVKYKEAFSRALVRRLLEKFRPETVLDPFAGVGTSVLTAAGCGIRATGIEIMPVGILTANAITTVANGVTPEKLDEVGKQLQDRIASSSPAGSRHAFPHVRITAAAFSRETEIALRKAREFIAALDDPAIRLVLNFACMSVLEAVSYTRKDGQYLRWDNRSGRKLRGKMHKGPIPSLSEALADRLAEIAHDIPAVKRYYGGGSPTLLAGSSLDVLRTLPSESVDLVLTSPPYANRYDYTRTYALELAWLGLDQEAFSALRQEMLSATVENRAKTTALRELYADRPALFEAALACYEEQSALHEVLGILRANVGDLGNRHVIRLLEGYFFEMTIIVAELARLVRPGGRVIMVNDNVQYHGQEVPVDLILADIAENFGFSCRNIWALARGKGNASQQMGRFGRREIRKCVYDWEKRT